MMRWRCGEKTFNCASPLIMGVVNATPDSFSDGGKFLAAEAATAQGFALLEDGADIIDVGGESTRPGAAAVDAEEEKRRVLPVIEKLAAAGAVVSADTMKPEVMRAALDCGAAIINDVNGFRAAGAISAVAAAQKNNCGLIVMHMQNTPLTMQTAPQYADVVGEVKTFLQNKTAELVRAGVDKERICIDPGIGFGKTAQHNKTLLANLPALSAACNRPVLIGVSRKSFFAAIADAPEERDAASAAAAALLAQRGAHIIRAHNVRATKHALAAGELLRAG